MDLATKVSLVKEADRVREVGDQLEKMETFTLELTRLTKRMDMEDMFGLMGVSTKVGFPMMSSNCFSIQAWKRKVDLPRWQRG